VNPLSTDDEAQRRFIDAVAQLGRLEAVVEHVPMMGVAALTECFSTLDKQAYVGPGTNVLFSNGGRETRPTCAGIELDLRAE
jgi:hypothetical protein